MASAANPYRDQRTQYDPGMGMDELCDALNLGLYIGVNAPSGASPTISSAIISFLQSGSATPETAQSRGRWVVNLTDFMSDADRAAIRAGTAVDVTTADTNARAVVAAGGVIIYPQGVLYVTSAIPITAGIIRRGQGKVDNHYGGGPGTYRGTFLYQATAATHLFTIGSKVWDIEVSDMTLSAVAPASVGGAAQAGKYAFKIEDLAANGSSYRMAFRNLSFHDFDRAYHVADADYEAASGTPTDWQCDAVLVERNDFFNVNRCFHFNSINADSWVVLNCTGNLPTNGRFISAARIGVFKAIDCYTVPLSAATGTELFRLAGYNSAQITLDHCSGSDSLGYFLHVDTTVGYDNVTQIIQLNGCQVEAPLLVEKQRHILSIGSMYTDSNPQCSGASCKVVSIDDQFLGSATGWTMSGTLPDFSQFPSKGSSTAGILNNNATTIFSVPDTATPVMYVVFAALLNANTAIYHANALLLYDGTLLTRMSGDDGANLTITVSSPNVQVTQTSGITQTIHWGFQRIG